MRQADGGSSSRIVVNPGELRRGATQLQDVRSRLLSVARPLEQPALPTMPEDLAGGIRAAIRAIAGELNLIPHPLEEGAIELRARALWADIADELAAGYPLSGQQLTEFMTGLRNGTIIRYADPWEAESAGRYLASMYADNYKQPDKLIDLAHILNENGVSSDAHAAFMAGFVDRFGTRLADIPRVIQAMEWTPGARLGGSYEDSLVDWDLGMKLHNEGYQLKVDPVELLGAFSMALALGTASGRVSRQVEHDIAWDEDRWAVAQLLHDGKFGANFLKEAFQSIVVSDIQRDASRLGPDMTAYMPIGMGDNEGPSISTDQRQLVLDALLRNPEGAALALSTDLPQEMHIASRWAPVDTRNPVAILYAAEWDDDGTFMSDLFREATQYSQSHLEIAGTSTEGNRATLNAVDVIINGTHRGDMSLFTEAVANDLARYHIPALLDATMTAGDQTDGGTAGFLDLDTNRIYLNGTEMEELFRQVATNETADKVLMKALGEGQAAFIVQQVHDNPGGAYELGRHIGTLNQYVLDAHDVQRQLDFEDAELKHKIATSVFSFGLDVLSEGKPWGVITGPLSTGAELIGAPSHIDVETENFRDKLNTVGATRALVAAAIYGYGGTELPHPSSIITTDGSRLIDYTRADGPHRVEFDQWVSRASSHNQMLEDALKGVSDSMFEHDR